jgi:hypothetical protein
VLHVFALTPDIPSLPPRTLIQSRRAKPQRNASYLSHPKPVNSIFINECSKRSPGTLPSHVNVTLAHLTAPASLTSSRKVTLKWERLIGAFVAFSPLSSSPPIFSLLQPRTKETFPDTSFATFRIQAFTRHIHGATPCCMLFARMRSRGLSGSAMASRTLLSMGKGKMHTCWMSVDPSGG